MNNLRPELLAVTRACEHLLSIRVALTEDERSLLKYYMSELSRELLLEEADRPLCRKR
jgi:hypothetical protein